MPAKRLVALFPLLVVLCGCGGSHPPNPIKEAPLDTSAKITITKLPGGDYLEASGINDDGMVVGLSRAYGPVAQSLVAWDPQGNLIQLQPPQEEYLNRVTAKAVNVHGLIAGTARGFKENVIVWEQAGPPVVRTASHYEFIQVSAINADGTIVGCGKKMLIDPLETTINVPLAWAESEERELSLPKGCNEGFARDINDSGTIVGEAGEAYNEPSDAVLWRSDGALVKLARPKGTVSAWARAINNSGVVVGYAACSGSGSGTTVPVVWDSAGEPRCLGLLPGYISGRAVDINDQGQIAGTLENSLGYRAVMWNPDGSIIDLGVPQGLDSSAASAINNNGQIVGIARDDYGRAILDAGVPVIWKVERQGQ